MLCPSLSYSICNQLPSPSPLGKWAQSEPRGTNSPGVEFRELDGETQAYEFSFLSHSKRCSIASISTSPAESSDVHPKGWVGDDRMVRCEQLTDYRGWQDSWRRSVPNEEIHLVETFGRLGRGEDSGN